MPYLPAHTFAPYNAYSCKSVRLEKKYATIYTEIVYMSARVYECQMRNSEKAKSEVPAKI